MSSRGVAGRGGGRRRGGRRRWLPLLALCLAPAPALAAVQGSPHDLVSQGYDTLRTSRLEELCSRCHLRSASAQRRFLPDVPPVLSQAYGPQSLVCFSCHDGTTIVSPNVDATRTAFDPASHGNDLSGYEELQKGVVDLPYLSARRMECVTCHDPHDDARRPFLRIELQELCLACHPQLAEYGRGKDNRSGSHILAPSPLGIPRDEVPLDIGEPFRTDFPSSYPSEGGKEAGSWHWDLGGHLGGGATGEMGCATCHAVHGDEATGPAPDLLAVESVDDVANLFCEGCHAGARGDGRPDPPHPNPGGTDTGRTYHAVDDDEANGTGRALEIREPAGWPFGGGSPRRLLCTTCHAAHGAWVETPLLRTPVAATSFCEECHEQVLDNHHPVGALENTGCFTRMSPPTYGTERGVLCASCHQAHNAGLGATREADYVPLLIAPAQSGELCATCHPADNPTCSTDPAYQASHFMGDPTLEETYEDPAPPLRTEPWPESGLTSSYGGEKQQVVTCLSCHSFASGALVSGDKGTTGHLVAKAGNKVEWQTGGENAYLCTGCHGLQPATASGADEQKGHTHPMMDASMERIGREPTAPVSMTPAGKVNCDSCHRPHAAPTKAGYYILEVLDSDNQDPKAVHPAIDFTVLCHGCHDDTKY